MPSPTVANVILGTQPPTSASGDSQTLEHPPLVVTFHVDSPNPMPRPTLKIPFGLSKSKGRTILPKRSPKHLHLTPSHSNLRSMLIVTFPAHCIKPVGRIVAAERSVGCTEYSGSQGVSGWFFGSIQARAISP